MPIPPQNSYAGPDVEVKADVDVEMTLGVDEEVGNEEGVS